MIQSDRVHRLEPRKILAYHGSTDRDNPDDVPLDEVVELIRKFRREAEESELRVKAMQWWKKCDSFVDGDQWGEVGSQLKPWQAKLTINQLYRIRNKWVSLLIAGIPDMEFLARDPEMTIIADTLDGYFAHEWDRNNWTTTVAIALKQAVTHGIGWIKVYWDIHGDGGRGTVRLEVVSNWDLFLDESAVIRDGKLVSKSVVHTFEMTRNKVLSVYGIDPGGEIISEAQQSIDRQPGSKQKKSQFYQYVDDLNVGGSVRGRGGSSGGDAFKQRHPDHAMKKDVFTVNEALVFDDSRVEGPEFDNAVGEIPPLKYPNGRIMTETNGKLLYDDANRLGFNMYVPFCLDPDVERIYTPSLIYHLISPQEELNKRRSQIADHASITANPILVISSRANVNQAFVPYPGATVTSFDMDSPTGGLFYLQAPAMSPEVVQSAVSAEHDIDKISSIEEILHGINVGGIESGTGVESLQQAAETVPQMVSQFVDGSLKTLGRNIASCFLDFTPDERKYRFLDTRALETLYGSFNPQEILLPSRRDAVTMVEQEIMVFHEQLAYAQQTMPPQEFQQFGQAAMQEIHKREQEIQQIWELPASDLISFDVMLKIGTRNMTQLAIQNQAFQMFELDIITVPRLMEMIRFPNWMLAFKEKQMELQARMAMEKEGMEEQVAIQREIDEDEHEQQIEIERLKGEFKIKEAEVRTRASQARAAKQ